MTEASQAALRRLLLRRYENLKSRLARHLGSSDLASEALQDTWLRLERREGIAAVHSYDAYLFRVAVNVARDRQRTEDRRLTTSEVETLLVIADEAPSSEEVAVARSDLRALEAVMAELPPRQRAILLAARLDGLPRDEIAKRYRISRRLVQRELQEAQDYCASRMKRPKVFTSSVREASLKKRPTGTGCTTQLSSDVEE